MGGKAHLAALKLTGKFVPFRFWKEIGDLRRARREAKQLKTSEVRLHIAKKERKLKKYIEEHKDGLQHAVNSVGFLFELIRNCAYDIHTIKSIIHDMHVEDMKLKKQGISPEIAHEFEKGAMTSLQKINSDIRKGSDMWGALTRE